MPTVRCPMRECRRRVDLDAIEPPPGRPDPEPCLHYVAAWDVEGGRLGGMAEAVLWGLLGNRELVIRNVRPAEVSAERMAEVRADLEAVARRFAHEAPAEGGGGALFGDVHERNQVAREYAHLILGPDPSVPPGAR